LLIVAGGILLVAVIAALVASSFAKKVSLSAPSETIDETKRTVKTLQTHA
jgi:hypothetical protein